MTLKAEGTPLHKEADKSLKKHMDSRARFKEPLDLWACAMRYFEWATDTDIHENRLVIVDGCPETVALKKTRPFYLDGFLGYSFIPRTTWYDYTKRDEFKDVVDLIQMVIKTQKFEGAAAGIFNATVMVRDLKLVDSISNELTGPDGQPLNTGTTVINMNPVGVDGG